MGQKRSYRATLDEVFADLAQALSRREKLEEKLADLKCEVEGFQQLAEGLGRMCGIDAQELRPDLFPEASEPELGFTDAVREAFRKAERLTLYDAVTVRDELKEMGFPLAKYKNPLASIHTILSRLVKQGELQRFVLEDEVRYGRPAKEATPAEPQTGAAHK